ncbi:Nonribosomal peptide synthetase 14 [Escovopsis weberi]|uniref:Nonribosomal peptide synthetase 14 n=1 Tax=Escovopsis weberi TaxID=150374 RepID=A0A0M8N0L5_ESCWE|nr:Nonribosomal peptide synthetase 14 [Escovopsis weberi]
MATGQQEPIAIVGTGCRFPGGANSPSALWKLLESPHDVGSQIGPDRFEASSFYHPDGSHHGTSNVLRSYLLEEDVRAFDAAFFNLSPHEADSMDPQQRLLLEVVYEALEAGGHAVEALRGSDTAVFVGTMTADYHDTLTRDLDAMPAYFATGTNRAVISNRVSYFFDWRGPSMTIDTACSSSLVAVHQAVRALRAGEARAALACGTHVLLNPDMFIGESSLRMLSPAGRCAMWSADADGYARGEGVAAVVLKTLGRAVADGDTVECVLRETGANQDGFSAGLTVPSAAAQAALIRDTYARAGLDPEREPRDRPHFFEAHGTGTQAGDPREAAAIHDCFGGMAKRATETNKTTDSPPLFVGSVKTVIGHLEGCAGLAGLVKAAAMIRSGLVPPNMHFSRLNPKVEPSYAGLCVPTRLMPWPELEEGVPRRVSVNSFGFGGTNAHAILEQYRPQSIQEPARDGGPSVPLAPFVFSASSEASLIAQLRAYSRHLKSRQEPVDPCDLAWTLSSRRSQLSTKVAFAALTVEQLTFAIDARLKEAESSRYASTTTTIGLRSTVKPGAARLLGVFTGQGAQWPAMGAHLIRSSGFVSLRIRDLEDSLAGLPPADRPLWSLRGEMLAGADASRIAEAALAQPLCTAVQIVLVDLLRAAGISFAAVVGHSSGEIAAAYAAGFIDARDAIRIAYYRGLFARLAGNGATAQKKGAMLAAGLSWEEAQELVSSEAFRGRIAVAAHNSPASVTLSGDADAVAEAKELLHGQKKFGRALKVDTAYHSHHMLPYGDRYVDALRACGVRVNRDRAPGAASCTTWYSSVTGSAEGVEPSDALRDVYWRDNMTNAVLFSGAIMNAVTGTEQIDLAIEVGPHPALRGPATQSISEVRNSPIPYTGLLSRARNDVKAFAESLGFVWTHLPQVVDFKSFHAVVTPHETRRPRLVLDLPSYQWNHERTYWAESRVSRRMRTRKRAHHEILGFLSTESNSSDMRWSNVLKQKEIPWLDGHQLQGQTVFPAAGYVAMALEASKVLAGDRPVELFELHKMTIPRAMTFEDGDDNSGVETLVTLTGIHQRQGDRSATAEFACYCVPVLTAGSEHDMELTASGTVEIVFGTPDAASLCPLPPDDYNMTPVDTDYFYKSIASIGYDYSGPFATLSSARRRLNKASALVDSYCFSDSDVSEYMVHPSLLDVAFQAAILAYTSPGDERLWALSIPTAIETIRVNPEVCAAMPTSGSKVPVLAIVDGASNVFSASIDLFSEHGEHGMIQVEDLVLKPFAPATEADDRTLFTYTKFDYTLPDGGSAVNGISPSSPEVDLAMSCERIALHLLQKWKSDLACFEYANVEQRSRWKAVADWVDQALSKESRAQDDAGEIQVLIARHHAESIDVKILVAIDQNLSTALLEGAFAANLISGDMMDEWHKSGLGFATYNTLLAGMLKPLVHRYPHARILEIGAGSGETTKSVLAAVGDLFSSYTSTDLFPDFVSTATDASKTHRNGKMRFAALDIEASPADQGFHPESFDIVIASNALIAATSLQTALENIRSLVKPGGYLILGDVTDASSLRCQIILSSAMGRWHGAIAEHRSSIVVTPGHYHQALRLAGFGGIDAHTPEIDGTVWPQSVIVSQAVDDRVKFLRRPISARPPTAPVYIESLVILGNGTLETARIGEEVAEYLERFCGETVILNGLPTEEDLPALNPQSTFVNLVDLDSPIFEDVTDEKMDGLKRMIEAARHILWVTHGGHVDQPSQMASIAFGRCVRQEAGHLTFHHMDVSDLEHNAAKAIAEYLLQQYALEEWGAPPSTLADKEHRDFELLWSREPEVFLHRGKLKVPRHVPHVEQNARLNSSRRIITKTVLLGETNVTILPPASGSGHFIVAQVAPRRQLSAESSTMSVLSSSLRALNTIDDVFFFVGVGADQDGECRIFLSTANSFRVSHVAALPVPINEPSHVNADGLLIAVTSELVSEHLVRQLSAGSRVLVHCSGRTRFLAKALARRAAAKAIKVTFVCDEQDFKRDAAWTQLNARLPNQALRKMIQTTKPTRFLDLTTSTSDLVWPDVQDLATPLEQLAGITQGDAFSVVHWPQSHELAKIEVRPFDAKYLFSKNKTYLLVGLSGQIGQSLAEWMVENGAGCICLTSRRPKVDQAWLDSFRESGAVVKVLSLDVLDMGGIEAAIEAIRASCHPIAGVVNGAVIFDDHLFANMSGDSMRRVLGPKVDGSINLDRAFYHDDLDFFVLLSSVVCVIGNAGQSNYAAANGFMDGLVRQRRRRGLAASALDLGRVAGIGYAEAAGQEVQEQLVKKLGLGAVSETDLRQLFAETIVAGFSRSEDFDAPPRAVLDTGLRTFRDDEDLRGPWFNNSFFSHLVEESGNAALGSDGADKNATLPVGQRLSLAANRDEALEILRESCADKLRSLLQLGSQKIDEDAPLLELGIDSLVAVEMRSWFLKSLKVDIPVLKIVGGASLSELCQRALEKLSNELVANASAQAEEADAIKPTTAVSRPQPLNRVPPSLSSRQSLVSSSASSDRGGGPHTMFDTPLTTATAPSTTGSVADAQESRPAVKYTRSERLSLPQSRFWFLRHLLEDPTTPNVIFKYHVTGNLRVGDLERAIRVVTARHEALRTCFVEDELEDGEVNQKILPTSAMRLERKKISSSQDVAVEYARLKQHVFDLESGDVMRINLLALSSTSHYLLIGYHHIVMDGASFNVFLADLEKAYKGQSPGAHPRQYPEFSVAQRAALERGEMKEELEYWRTSMRSTPFHLHLAAFKALLFCFAGDETEDLTIGIADAARNDSNIEGSIGFFLNLLTLRFKRRPEQSFADSIVEARDTAYSALGSSRLPFDVLLTELNVARSSLHSPFFQAFLDYRQGIKERHPWGNCQFELQDVHPGRTAYDLTLDVTEMSKTETLVMFRVQKSLYDATAANLLLKTYIHFLDALTKDATAPLKSMPLFSEAQLTEAIQIGRGPALVSDWPGTLPLRIDQIAQENEDKVALMDGRGKIMTYADMINRIEAIGESLQDAGVGEGSRVLVYQEPAADWPCSMLAIMRLGAVYVPLDLRNPINRLATVARDCRPAAILADATTIDTAPRLDAVDARIIDVSTLPLKSSARVDNRSQEDSPAAILYTSGSTGAPKGIMVTHAGLRNEIEGYTKTWGLGAERVLQQSAFTFNHSSDQMYTGLVNGGMVYVVPADKRGDPLEITKILQEHAITYTKATPSEYSLWIQFGGEDLRQASSWRSAFGGGEPLTGIVTQEFADLELPQLRLFNSYGPTEISISSHKIEVPYRERERERETIENTARIPCGYPLPNYFTYVVDEQLRPLPVGMPGEICIGGAGVSRGYLNNQELTDRCFVTNPFATPEDVSRGWTGMYRTGDVGHLREDGAMVFHSRMAGDSQVKIRGLRIELSDIESNMVAAAGGALREAVVTLRDGDPPFLVAHVVFSPQNHHRDVSDKESFLQSLLGRLPIPQYMVPVVAVPLDKFPLSSHSKVNRKAVQRMPLPVRSSSAEAAAASGLTETMEQLKRIWHEVLGKNVDKFGFDVGPKTDFFLVGGNSLLVIRLQAQIRQVFRVVVPLVKLLGASTLGGMASKVEEGESVTVIDWEEETRPPSIPSFLRGVSAKEEPSAAKKVLVTGSTGYLARHVLPRLAARPDVDTIHCVAVRDRPRETAPFASPKVAYHVGDLSLPHLGLSVDEFRGLAGQVDAVLHMGAVRSFWDNYHVLQASNVSPVRELVKLAAPRRVPIHLISTVGVLPRLDHWDGSVSPEARAAGSAAAHAPPPDGSNGYVSSKWAAERILERSEAALGVPCTIYRFAPASPPPTIDGDDDDHHHRHTTPEKQALLDSLLRVVDASGLTPDMSVWKGRLDMLPSARAAALLSESVSSTATGAPDATTTQEAFTTSSTPPPMQGTRFVHCEGAVAVHTDEVSAHIARERGAVAGLRSVPVIEWFGRAKALGFEYMIAAQEAVVGGSGEVLESRR